MSKTILLRSGWIAILRNISYFTPPKRLALFKMREMILKGRKLTSWLKKFNFTRNKGVHTMKLVLYNKTSVLTLIQELKDKASKFCMKQRNKGVQLVVMSEQAFVRLTS